MTLTQVEARGLPRVVENKARQVSLLSGLCTEGGGETPCEAPP